MKKQNWLKWLSIFFFTGIVLLAVAYFLLDNHQEPLRMEKEARKNAPGEMIQLSQGITHYQLLGPSNGDLVVLIHGGMVSGMYAWEHNYQYLINQGFRVLMYDLYGRGYSDRVEADYTPQLFFSQFEELLDSLQIQKPFSLAGLSMGSMVAIEYTRQHPDMVQELMILSPAARGKLKLNPALKVPILSDLLMTFYWFPRTIDSQMAEFHQPDNFPEYREMLKEMVRFKGYKSSNYSTWVNTLTYNMEEEIKEVGAHHIPVGLVLGEHDPYVTADEGESYQKLLPNLKIFQVKGAGHVVNFEQPQTVNPIMSKFFISSPE